MMLRKFLKDSSTYTLPKLVSISINFVVLPIYTRLLTPNEYGMVEMITIAYSLLNLLLTLEVSQGMARHLPDAASTSDKINYASTSFWFSLFVFFIFVILCLLFPYPLNKIILDSMADKLIFYLAIFIICSNALIYQIKNILKWNLKAKAWSATTIIGSLVSHAFAIFFISILKLGIHGYLLGISIGLGAALAIGFFSTQKSNVPIGFAFDLNKLRNMLIFSTPLVLSSAASYITVYTDRWMLNSMLGIEDVGIYSVAFRIASVITILIVGIQQALVPLIYHHYKETDTPQNIADILRFFLLLILPAVAFLSAFSKEILTVLVGPNFIEAHILLSWLALSIVVLNLYIFAPGMGLTKKTKKIALANIFAAAVNIFLNMVLIGLYGRIGAAFATLGGGTIMAGLYFTWSSKEYKIPYPWKRFFTANITLLLLMITLSNFELHLLVRLLLWIITAGIIGRILLNVNEFNKMKVLLQLQFAR